MTGVDALMWRGTRTNIAQGKYHRENDRSRNRGVRLRGYEGVKMRPVGVLDGPIVDQLVTFLASALQTRRGTQDLV